MYVLFFFSFLFFSLWLWRPRSAPLWRAQCERSSWGAALTWLPGKEQAHAPSVSPRLFALACFPLFPRVLSHTWTNRSTSRWPRSHFSFLTCVATAHALRALFPPFSPLLPLCLFMLLLLLLPDIFRDELQSTAGGKKNVGGAVSATCVPLLSFSLSRGPLLFPYRTSSFSLTSPALFHSLYICPCPPLIYIPLFSALLFFIFLCPSNLSLNPPIIWFL